MLQCCVIEFEGNQEKYLLLAEFAYNNSYQSSIKMAPYNAFYECKCISLLYWLELKERKLVGKTEDKVRIIRDNLKAASDILPWRKVLHFSRKGKLSSRFIEPYETLERIRPVTYQLALPLKLDRIHNVFHVSMLCCYRSDLSQFLSPNDIELQLNLT
ncbi:DNA/RNA polymerases superfamily protein [Gossypium australe]|uniref:DNA/RNA polymerases superfamily protein n=1 Tax=Gossypium australe TaxID=47621 RepID=A0A5B6VCG2_9ROSI|nr:DNA/RNA polymerases superfamily protein [Gossypium australe]